MKFGFDDIDNYVSQSAGFFGLKDDGDSCNVRFMYESIRDFNGYCCHRVRTKDGKFTSINCLRGYNDPQEMCPLCSSPILEDRKTEKKTWIPIYKVDESEVALWDRSTAFFKKCIYPLMVQKGEPFCANIFTITRRGVAGDSDTRYEITFESSDDTTLDDFDMIPSPDGVYVQDMDFDTMKDFIKNRTLNNSSEESTSEDAGVYRRGSRNSEEEPTVRRGTRPNMV